jgi:hypothetical protein
LAGLTPHVHPHHIMQHPARRRLVHPFTLRVGTRRRLGFACRTATVCPGGRPHQPHGHHPHQGPDARRLVQLERRGETLRVVQTSAPALRVHLAVIALHHRLRRPWGRVECRGGHKDTTVRVEAGVPGRERRGQRPVALVDHLGGSGRWAGSTPCAIARLSAHRAGAQNRRVHVRRNGRKRLTRRGLARDGRGTSGLQGVAVLGTLRAPRLVDGAVRLRSAGLSGAEDPTWLNAAVGRGQLTSAIAGCARCPGLRSSWGPDAWRGVHGCRHPREPREGRRRERWESRCTLAGALRHQRGSAIGGVPRLDRGANRLAHGGRSTAVATARLQAQRKARLRRHDARHDDLVDVRPLIPAVPSGHRHHLCLRRLVAVVAPIDVNTRAIEMGHAGRKAQALGSGRGHEAGAFGDPRGIERLQGPTAGGIGELGGSPTGRHEAVGGVILAQPGDEVERVMPTPQAIAPHRVAGFPHGEVPQCRVLWRGSVAAVAQAEGVEHASHQAEVGHHWATV